MSIENNIASIAKSLERIADALTSSDKTTSLQVVQQPVVSAPPVAPVQQTYIPAPPVPVSFPAPVIAPTGLPFTDKAGMTKWIMDEYKAMGATKGARIQQVLESIGHKNVNDVTPDKFAALVAGIEVLKAQP